MLFDCEVAVGYSHGQWSRETLPVFISTEGDGDMEECIREACEAAALADAEEQGKAVSFVVMLHYSEMSSEEPQ